MPRLRDFYDHKPDLEKDRAALDQFLDHCFPDRKRLRQLRELHTEALAHLLSVEAENSGGQAIAILRARVASLQEQIEALERTARLP